MERENCEKFEIRLSCRVGAGEAMRWREGALGGGARAREAAANHGASTVTERMQSTGTRSLLLQRHRGSSGNLNVVISDGLPWRRLRFYLFTRGRALPHRRMLLYANRRKTSIRHLHQNHFHYASDASDHCEHGSLSPARWMTRTHPMHFFAPLLPQNLLTAGRFAMPCQDS